MSEKKSHLPVFFDPNNKRWTRLRKSIYFAGLFFSLAFGVLILSILINPNLPNLKIEGKDSKGHPVAALFDPHQKELNDTKRKIEKEIALRRASIKKPFSQSLQTGEPLSVGFYVNWDESSMTSLKDNIQRRNIQLDILIVESKHLADESGNLEDDDADKQSEVLEFVHQHSPHTRVMALVNNARDAQFQKNLLAKMLASSEARHRTIDQLFHYAEDHKLDGVSIDFENLDDTSRAHLVEFMNELYPRFRNAGLDVSINLPADDEAFDYGKLSAAADYVILMVYDEHDSSSGEDGPVASQDWFQDILRLRQLDVPAEKTIVAIGSYAYDWEVEDKNGKPLKAAGETRTFEEAILTAKESSYPEASANPQDLINIALDSDSLNPYFEYADDEDNVHRVWFLDAVTAFNQMSVARAFSPRGFALWRLGSEDPSIWDFLGKPERLNRDTAESLSKIVYGYNLDYEGKGECLEIVSYPRDGERAVSYDDKSGVIKQESYRQFPSPFVIKRYGYAKNKIALTFDDGPDPNYTPQILDILKKYQAPATFFYIGLQGELYPEILRREYDEGHDIGSHTFTHPNASSISDIQFNLELSANDVLLESIIGHRTTLFRPPFAQDAEPTTPSETRMLKFINDRGYIDVGMLIDPHDWQQPKVTTDEIVEATVAEALKGRDKSNERPANIVLLHDSGGVRQRTIEALPQIIERLRDQGFELVTVSELLGKPRDEVMPPVPSEGKWRMLPARVAFQTINIASMVLRYLFLAGIVLGIFRLLFIGTLAIIEHERERHLKYDNDFKPTVAVIVPAYNEEKVIVQTIASLLASDLPDFEIVVVDDGSTDKTAERILENFANEKRVRFFTKANAGKPEALNFGVQHTDAEIVIALDADTIFTRDTIRKLARHFVDRKIGAVAGNAKVGNRINLMTRWQALEYVTSQNLDRRAFNVLNCITVVPGAVGAWRRELVLQAGGFNDLTLAEDADLTMAIRKLGYRVAYEDEAIALTEAPDTVRGFIKQRFRWMYGTLQAAWRHKNALLNPRYGSLGFIALPNVLIFQVLFPLISPVMDLLMVISLASTIWYRIQHPADTPNDTVMRVAFFYALFLAIDFLAAALAFLLEAKENKRLLVWLFLQRFFYRQLMYYVAIKATLASLKGIAVGWNKLERKATVKV
ncbi:MAG: glycosyltransferase [Acidobacteriota bacterium]